MTNYYDNIIGAKKAVMGYARQGKFTKEEIIFHVTFNIPVSTKPIKAFLDKCIELNWLKVNNAGKVIETMSKDQKTILEHMYLPKK